MRQIVIGALVTWVAAIGCSRHPDAEQRAHSHAPIHAAEAEHDGLEAGVRSTPPDVMSSLNEHIDHLEEAMRQQIATESDGRKPAATSSAGARSR